MHDLWNLHRHSSRASLSPTSYSSMQMVHSCGVPSSLRQSFSVAVNDSMRRRCCDCGEPMPGEDRSPPEDLAMQSRTCASRSFSLPSLPRGGSCVPQIGQISLSSTWTRCGGRDVRVRSDSAMDRTLLGRVPEGPKGTNPASVSSGLGLCDENCHKSVRLCRNKSMNVGKAYRVGLHPGRRLMWRLTGT